MTEFIEAALWVLLGFAGACTVFAAILAMSIKRVERMIADIEQMELNVARRQENAVARVDEALREIDEVIERYSQ